MPQQHLNQSEIRWTDYDVPHIQAESYESLGFGYGYVHGRDRLLELSGQAIALRGERSKYFGAEAISTIGFLTTTNLNSDLMYRLRLPQAWVAAELERLSPQARAYVQGYVEGLNAYVNGVSQAERDQLFADEPWVTFEPEDVIRATMRFGVMKELVEIGPYLVSSAQDWQTCSAEETASHHAHGVHAQAVGVEGGVGSNAWAFGGDVAAGEGAILLGNPHSAWQRTPHQQRIYMHQYHLTIPGELDVAGTSFLGFPLPMSGYNADVAWSILDAASVTPYVLQKMAIQLTGDRPTYLMDGVSHPLSTHTIDVDVLEATGSVETRQFTFLSSPWGTLYHLPERSGKPEGWYALTNPGEQNARGLDQFLAAAKATSTRDFVAAIEQHRGILCQLVVADRIGDVAYVVAGNVPPMSDEAMARCHVDDPQAAFHVLDGTRSECSCRDAQQRPLFASRAFYPTLISRGIIHNTNNSYQYTEYGKVQPDYPSVFGQHKVDHQIGKHIAAGLKYDPRLIMSVRRLGELLAQSSDKPAITAEQALQIIFDNRNYAAETFLDGILSLEQWTWSTEVHAALTVLKAWDRKNNSESRGALLFHLFWHQIVQTSLLQVPSSGDPTQGSHLDITAETLPQLAQALEHAVTELRTLGFSLDEAWGNVLSKTAHGISIPLHGGSYQEGLLNGEMPAPLTSSGFPYILFGTAYLQLVYWETSEIVVDGILSHGQRDGVESQGRTAQLKLFSRKQLYRIPFLAKDLTDESIRERLIIGRTEQV